MRAGTLILVLLPLGGVYGGQISSPELDDGEASSSNPTSVGRTRNFNLTEALPVQGPPSPSASSGGELPIELNDSVQRKIDELSWTHRLAYLQKRYNELRNNRRGSSACGSSPENSKEAAGEETGSPARRQHPATKVRTGRRKKKLSRKKRRRLRQRKKTWRKMFKKFWAWMIEKQFAGKRRRKKEDKVPRLRGGGGGGGNIRNIGDRAFKGQSGEMPGNKSMDRQLMLQTFSSLNQ